MYNNNKTFQVAKSGKTQWIVIRQVAGLDRIYKLGDRIKGHGLIVGIKVEVK